MFLLCSHLLSFSVVVLFERGGLGAASEFCLFPFSSCWYDDTHVIPALPHNNNMILTNRTNKTAVMPIYRRICKFVLFFHLIILSGIYKNNIFMYSSL